MEFVVYTDARSKKVEALQKNQKVQLLFFDPKRLWQLTVAAELKVMRVAPEIFKQLPPASKKDYTVRLAPGTPIANPNDIEYQEESFFYHLTFTANKIESLRLKRPNHLRAVFEKEQQWKGKFLTP
jgi:pyridoxamine 5'-phosphate oxidase